MYPFIFISKICLTPRLILSQQRHTACELIDLFLCSADSNTKIPQRAFGDVPHFFNELVIGLAALGQIGEVHNGQVLEILLIQLFPYLFDNLRRSPQNGDGKFDDAKMPV